VALVVGIAMKILTARWVAGCVAAVSIVAMAGALVLAYVDRDLLPASLTGWTFNNVSGQIVNLAVPVVGLFLRPGGLRTVLAGCS
jgi:hypothetical protein